MTVCWFSSARVGGCEFGVQGQRDKPPDKIAPVPNVCGCGPPLGHHRGEAGAPHVGQRETKEITSIGCGSGEAWQWRGRKSSWKANGAMLKFPDDHLKGRAWNHEVRL